MLLSSNSVCDCAIAFLVLEFGAVQLKSPMNFRESVLFERAMMLINAECQISSLALAIAIVPMASWQ
jgi:hypothetical protein